MATAAKKVNVKVSMTVPVKELSFSALSGAKETVGAPDNATVSTGGNAGVAPVPNNPDGTPNTEDFYPFTVTFSWSEDK